MTYYGRGRGWRARCYKYLRHRLPVPEQHNYYGVFSKLMSKYSVSQKRQQNTEKLLKVLRGEGL